MAGAILTQSATPWGDITVYSRNNLIHFYSVPYLSFGAEGVFEMSVLAERCEETGVPILPYDHDLFVRRVYADDGLVTTARRRAVVQRVLPWVLAALAAAGGFDAAPLAAS